MTKNFVIKKKQNIEYYVYKANWTYVITDIYISKYKNNILITFPNIIENINGDTFSLLNPLPEKYRPKTTKYFIARGIGNNGLGDILLIKIFTNGIIRIYANIDESNFGIGNKGLIATSISYNI